jgi:hypothetical protein
MYKINSIWYIKHTHSLDLLQDQRFRQFLNCVENVLDTSHNDRDRTSIEYIIVTVDGIFRRSASSGRTISTFKAIIKQTQVSKISIWHA